MIFNLEKWSSNIYVFENIDDINLDKLSLQEKTLIEIKNLGKPIHLLVGGLHHNKNFLVGLGGAISNRSKGMTPPYFSFLNIANHINSGYILVSDSTLYTDEELKIGWYAGSENNLNFQKNIALIIDLFAKYYDSRPTLTGGSGGGFAALAISSLLNVHNNVFVWNPQTNITRYAKKFVNEFLEAAFPSYIKEDLDESFTSIKSLGIISDITSMGFNEQSEVVYLQNNSDWHTAVHTQPLLDNHDGFVKFKTDYYERYICDDNFNLLIANWGQGHQSPPKSIIEFILEKLIKDHNAKRTMDALISGFSKDLNIVEN